MRNLLLGVGIAWLGLTDEGKQLTNKIINELKDKYLTKPQASKEKKETKEEKNNV